MFLKPLNRKTMEEGLEASKSYLKVSEAWLDASEAGSEVLKA